MLKAYIVTNKRQRDYLYSLGFDCSYQKEDGKEIWVFDRTDMLLEAIDFYCKFRNRLRGSK